MSNQNMFQVNRHKKTMMTISDVIENGSNALRLCYIFVLGEIYEKYPILLHRYATLSFIEFPEDENGDSEILFYLNGKDEEPYGNIVASLNNEVETNAINILYRQLIQDLSRKDKNERWIRNQQQKVDATVKEFFDKETQKELEEYN